MKQKRMKPLLFITLLCIVTLCLSTANASSKVEPGKFIFSVKRGQKSTGAIKVTNTGDREAEFKAVLYDWTVDDKDEAVFSEPGTRPESLKGYIKFNPQHFKLAPGETQIVRFTLSAPDEESQERRGMVFFEDEIKAPNGSVGANVVMLVGSTIYMTIEPAKRSFKVPDISLGLRSGHLFCNIKAKNDGQAHIRFQVNYKILTVDGKVVNQGKSQYFVILPGFERPYTFPIEGNLPTGKYNLVMDIKFVGNPKTLQRTVPFVLN